MFSRHIKGFYLSLPLSVSHHAGGVWVEETASSLGLAWSLNAADIISRTIMGRADEGQYGFMRTPDIAPFTTNSFETYVNYDKGLLDGQADIFNYNFDAFTGKFVLNNDSQIVKPMERGEAFIMKLLTQSLLEF